MRRRTVTVTTTMDMAMTTEGALYRLMTWLSPAYPLGAFSYSHGLEYAVEIGQVTSGASLAEWVTTVLEHGAGQVDGALFAAAWRAMESGDNGAFDTAAELASAWRGSAETALESTAQGAAFLTVTRAAWPEPRFERLASRYDGALALSVAVGAACALHGLPLLPSLIAYLQAFAANLVSAGVRLVPLGQTDGQRAIACLEAVVTRAAATALDADLDALATSAPLLDLMSMKHETQYTRLFRS